MLFWSVEADVEVGAGDYRQLSGTGADLSGCGFLPLGKSSHRSGASDLLQALACLTDEPQPHVGIGSDQYVPFHPKGQY